jgi:diguanylate cyclase (GGDEF)-like protein
MREVQDVTSATAGLSEEVMVAVVEATRALLWVKTEADARLAAETLVRGLGGVVVPAHTGDADGLPADISFGDGEPRMAAAPAGSTTRAHLDKYLVPFLVDARRALQLSGRVERLDEDASTDRLTSLPNRRSLDRALGRLAADDTVIVLDLDHFKGVNDQFGHQTGDQVLRAFGEALRSVIRGTDFVGRFGGEEFVVILSSPLGAESFLERLREEWSRSRPLPITFSAGVARSVGASTAALRLADEALYKAKAAGRDQWLWARSDDVVSDVTDDPLPNFVDPYIDAAVSGQRRSAIRTTLDMFNRGVTHDRVIDDLLAAAQREVGERWHRNQLTVADEHIATGVSTAALDALVSETRPIPGDGHTVVVCAEGDWHSLAAQMFAEALHGHGVGVTVLGPSTPAPSVAELLTRRNADSLAISCSVPIFFPGVTRLIDIAHHQGIPVIVGGRAFGTDATRAERLGADAWAATAADAAKILKQWRLSPPPVERRPTDLDSTAMHMMEQAAEIADASSAGLVARFPSMADYDGEQLARTREDLTFNVQFLAAAMLVADDTLFTDYLEWLQTLLASRGVPRTALPAGLEALRACVHDTYPSSVQLLDLGHRTLINAPVGSPSAFGKPPGSSPDSSSPASAWRS